MIARNQRREILGVLELMKSDLICLIESLTKKDNELSELEACDETSLDPITSPERRLRIEGLVYDIVSGRDIHFLNDVQRFIVEHFDDPVPEDVA